MLMKKIQVLNGSIELQSALNRSEILVDLLVVAGGGGGGFDCGGGGGAGGFYFEKNILLPKDSTYTVRVGQGGKGANSAFEKKGHKGENSTFGNLIIMEGGGGGGSAGCNGGNGGSGGGGGINGKGGKGVVAFGNEGGSDTHKECPCKLGGAGGGGASNKGYNAHSLRGQGGEGKKSCISGVSRYYAGGGGAGRKDIHVCPCNNVGQGGGGCGGNNLLLNGKNGLPNTGGGGGGGGNNGEQHGKGGNGGSGIIIIQYPAITPLAVGGEYNTFIGDGHCGEKGVQYIAHTYRNTGIFYVFKAYSIPNFNPLRAFPSAPKSNRLFV